MMNDWNKNGTTDNADTFIEYQIYQDVMGKDKHHVSKVNSNSASNNSFFSVFLCGISGIVIQAIIYTFLGIEVEEIPIFIVLLLWFIFSSIAGIFIKKWGI